MFVALSIDSIFFSFSLKNLHKPIWSINILSNKYLLLALALSITMLLSAMFIPFMQQLLSLVPLGGKELLALFGIGIINLITIEIAKYGIFEYRRCAGKKD
jgi:P-type Ca2+ transporter type 2C